MLNKKHMLLFVALAFIFGATIAYAAPPQTMHFQGYLKDSSNDPVDGNVDIVFALYDVSTGGSALWTETHNAVPVTDGVYSVVLGSSTPIDLAFDTTYYLGVKVGADSEMTPRQELASSAYAMKAKRNVNIHEISTATQITTTGYVDVNGSTFQIVSNGASYLFNISLPTFMTTNSDSGFGTIALNIDGADTYTHAFYLHANGGMNLVRTETFKYYTNLGNGAHTIKLRAKCGYPSDSSTPLQQFIVIYPTPEGAKGMILAEEL